MSEEKLKDSYTALANQSAFEKIYLQYYPLLLVYGKAIVHDEALVEDTIQELFVAFWKKGEDLNTKSSLENYLLVSLRNNLIRKLKANKTVELNMDLAETDTSQNEILDREARLNNLIEKLPARQREVIFLRYFKNKSYQEIADLLGISYQVARNFSYRAIQFLRKNMKSLYSIFLSLTL
ncbi:MAG: sigma-70 family RNA polymerase sigma factor [Bacteroidota bacterium]